MHAGKTLDLLSRRLAESEFTVVDYAIFDALISGLERDIRDWGDNWPMGDVRHHLHSARLYFQEGRGIGDEGETNWDRVRMWAHRDLYALQNEYLAEDKKGFKRSKETPEAE